MAQWIARWTSDPEVVGSSPTLIVFSFSLMIRRDFNGLNKYSSSSSSVFYLFLWCLLEYIEKRSAPQLR